MTGGLGFFPGTATDLGSLGPNPGLPHALPLEQPPSPRTGLGIGCLGGCGRRGSWARTPSRKSGGGRPPLAHGPDTPSPPTGRGSPGFIAAVHEVGDVLERRDGQLGEPLHIRPHDGVLTHTQVPTALGAQEIPHTLTVDLHVAHLGREGGDSGRGSWGGSEGGGQLPNVPPQNRRGRATLPRPLGETGLHRAGGRGGGQSRLGGSPPLPP